MKKQNSEKKKMKKWQKVIVAIVMIPAISAALFAGVYLYADNKPDIHEGYQKEITTGGTLEEKYLNGGGMKTARVSFRAEDPVKKISVWYPQEMENTDQKRPVLFVINGTGGKATKYKPQFEMYASWGFITVGTQDKGTGTGKTTVETMQFMLEQNETPESIFYQKIDTDNIGITGFSQGGAAVFNVLTKYEEGKMVKAAAPLSPVSEVMTAKTTNYSYDSSLVKCPILIMAGTEGDFETEIVIPKEELEKQYAKISAPKAMARRTGMDHDHMMYSAGGYVMAWFRWQLMGDKEAAGVFTGNDPELLHNSLYQDQKTDLQ